MPKLIGKFGELTGFSLGDRLVMSAKDRSVTIFMSDGTVMNMLMIPTPPSFFICHYHIRYRGPRAVNEYG